MVWNRAGRLPTLQAARARMRAHAPEGCSGSFSRGEERRPQGASVTWDRGGQCRKKKRQDAKAGAGGGGWGEGGACGKE